MNRDDPSARTPVPNIPGSYYDLITTARRHFENDRVDEAAVIYERVVERLSRLPEKRRRHGSAQASFLIAAASDLFQVFSQQARYEEADQLAQELMTWDAEDATYWQRQRHILRIERGEVQQGLTDLHSLAESQSDSFGHWLVLAHKGIDTDHLDVAQKALERALASADDAGEEEASALVHFAFYRLYRRRGQWLEAGQAWERAAALDEEIQRTQEVIARMFLEAGMLDDAIRYLDEAVLTEPIANHYLAWIANRRGDKVRARYLWRQVASADVDAMPHALVVKAIAHCWLREPLKALSVLLHDVKLNRELGQRHALTLALAWAMQGRLDMVLSNITIARKYLPKRGDERLSWLDWQDFEELVEDQEIKQQIRGFFESGPDRDA